VALGFNSGWLKMQGIAPPNFDPNTELVTFDGKGKYNDPQFIWRPSQYLKGGRDAYLFL
jgi:hypothetical protein